jgi:hypothetical protein
LKWPSVCNIHFSQEYYEEEKNPAASFLQCVKVLTLGQAIACRKAEKLHNELQGVANKRTKLHAINFANLRVSHPIPFRKSNKKSGGEKLSFSPHNSIGHYSYKDYELAITASKDIAAVFPDLNSKIYLDVNFHHFALDFSLRECSLPCKFSSYEELNSKFENPMSTLEGEEIVTS